MIFYNYEGYFGKRKQKTDDEEEQKGFGPQANFNIKKWQWMLMVDKLVKELNMTPDGIYKMNYINCLNWLSMYHEKETYEKMNRKGNGY
jgi:hypothetical protein